MSENYEPSAEAVDAAARNIADELDDGCFHRLESGSSVVGDSDWDDASDYRHYASAALAAALPIERARIVAEAREQVARERDAEILQLREQIAQIRDREDAFGEELTRARDLWEAGMADDACEHLFGDGS